jgi:hypothetical protein
MSSIRHPDLQTGGKRFGFTVIDANALALMENDVTQRRLV